MHQRHTLSNNAFRTAKQCSRTVDAPYRRTNHAIACTTKPQSERYLSSWPGASARPVFRPPVLDEPGARAGSAACFLGFGAAAGQSRDRRSHGLAQADGVALDVHPDAVGLSGARPATAEIPAGAGRSEEHTSELQSR